LRSCRDDPSSAEADPTSLTALALNPAAPNTGRHLSSDLTTVASDVFAKAATRVPDRHSLFGRRATALAERPAGHGHVDTAERLELR
jgi:hypothetical protein